MAMNNCAETAGLHNTVAKSRINVRKSPADTNLGQSGGVFGQKGRVLPGKVWISWKIGRSCTPLPEFLGRGRKVDPINSLNGLVCKYGFVIIHLQTYNMYMMITSSANRVQTGFRLEPIVLARVKEAARQQNISANEFVNRTLKEATQSIESEQEREECRKHPRPCISR